PILLLRMSDSRRVALLDILVRAHQLWRARLFHVDLVILRLGASGYEEPVRERVQSLMREAGGHRMMGRRGGIHLVFADQITDEDRRLLESAAAAILDEGRGPLASQLERALIPKPRPPRFEPPAVADAAAAAPTAALDRPAGLQFDNGLGGFSADGSEYVLYLAPGQHPPAPWCNLLANETFGALVSESGSGFTWALNSGENRLTPWRNDPVCDPPSEALYLRDEETAAVWTPTPQPAGAAACQVRHGCGYTTWHSRSHGLAQTLSICVAPDAPVKIVRLRLENLQSAARRLTATYYAEWLLGALPSIARMHVVGEYDAASQALLARNPWNPEFAARVAFLTADRPPHSLSMDRRAFLGADGDLARPAALARWDLGGLGEPGADPCAAFQVHLDIAAGDSTEVAFFLGQGDDRAHALALIARCRAPGFATAARDAVDGFWRQRLEAVQVETPDPACNLMLNRWLLYQTLASRVLARAGFYQAGGAIGFRDQLQDMLALIPSDPARVRAHILDCAAHQFEEGDVLHWWHPPQGRGVRTHCSDDLLWLPYVVACYVDATGDSDILHEPVAFLRAAELAAEEEDRYGLFETSPERRSLFEHCQRALERGVTQGPHGLPLIGGGDWNDGMNRLGRRGRGESVWLGWFAIAAINGFAGLADRLRRDELARHWRTRAQAIARALDAAAWDGAWYVRAFDDDGQTWGSAANEECRIDSIAQSWSVLAGGGQPARARTAVAAAEAELVRDADRLVCLLWPPFHETPRDPGYIKAYPPGIRENGGQYSHAAAWLGLALAQLGEGDAAWRVFDILNPIRRVA
ncbi:MAG: cellobiose phosphorylase, partial [Alphaproteobacteria bacterium]